MNRNQYLHKWRKDMGELDRAKKRSDVIQKDIEEMFLNMPSYYDCEVISTEFSGRSIMVGGNGKADMDLTINVSIRFKV